jgi:Uma2 family endonuclease
MATVTTPDTDLLQAVPEDSDVLYEVVNGQRVEVLPMGALEGFIAFALGRRMADFADAHNLGLVVVEVLFALMADGSLKRRPDVAFVCHQRWPERTPPKAEAWNVVPDLAVEVISESNLWREVLGKVRGYFDVGVRLVWVIDPALRVAYVYSSPTQVRVLQSDGELDGEAVLPGFRLSIAALFEAGTKSE